ncbi:MAG: toprim domain-containing protein [Acutalibacteraceae bacterium]
MIKIKEAVIVEGKYDKIKLSGLIDAPIIETNGFRIFKDREKAALLKTLAHSRGIIILTDSDSAGFVIRSHIKGIVGGGRILNAYVPEILGKEKRKSQPSKENLLGVEGLADEYILNALKSCGATFIDNPSGEVRQQITKTDLYNAGLSGRENSAQLRQKLLERLNLPKYITAKALPEILNCLITAEEFEQIVNSL